MSDTTAPKGRKALRYGVELIVVFLGVWLSFVAENWRQDQADERTARSSIARMAEDLESDLADFVENIERAEEGVVLGRWLLSRGVADDAPLDSIGRALTSLQFCSFLVENTAEYEALRNSGRLGIISDPELRRAIVAEYEQRSLIRRLHEDDCAREAEIFGLVAHHIVVAERDFSAEQGPYGFSDGRNPRVIGVPGRSVLMRDPAFLSLTTRLLSSRGFMVQRIKDRIEGSTVLRDELLERLR